MSTCRRGGRKAFGRNASAFRYVVIAILMTGCAVIRGPKADETKFYALTPPAVTTSSSGPPAARLLVRRVEIPGYLQGKAFAIRAQGGEVRYEQGSWWSEPVDLAIARAVRERIGAATGIAPAARRDSQYDLEAVIRVSRFEGEVGAEKSSARLVATVEVIDPASGRRVAERRGSFEDPWDGKDYGALAGLLGGEVGKLADLVMAAAARR